MLLYICTVHLHVYNLHSYNSFTYLSFSPPPSPLPPLALALFHLLSGVLQLFYIFTIHLNALSRILQIHQGVRFLGQNAVRFDRWAKSSSAA